MKPGSELHLLHSVNNTALRAMTPSIQRLRAVFRCKISAAKTAVRALKRFGTRLSKAAGLRPLCVGYCPVGATDVGRVERSSGSA